MPALENPTDLAAVQAALAQGNGLSASSFTPGSAAAGMVDTALTSSKSSAAGVVAAAGVRPANIMLFGHSHTAGQGAGTGTQGLVGGFAAGVSGQMPAALAKYGINAPNNAVHGDGNTLSVTSNAVSMAQWDTRVALGTGWANYASGDAIGGRMPYATGATSGKYDFAPGFQFKDVTVYFVRNAGLSTALEVYIDDVLKGTIDTSAATASVGVTTITGAGSKISLKNAGTGAVYVPRVECTPFVNTGYVFSAATRGGSVMADISATTYVWSPGSMIPIIAPEVSIIYCMFNDVFKYTGTMPNDVATYTTALETILANATNRGSALLVIDPAGNVSSNFTSGVLETYTAQAITSASKYSARIINLRDLFSRSWSTANARGLMYDGGHFNAMAAQKAANLIAREVAKVC